MTVKKSQPAKPDDDHKVADEKMVTFVPSESFQGWPFGYKADRKGTPFTRGIESIPVPQSYADLMREKGYVADKQTTEPAAGE